MLQIYPHAPRSIVAYRYSEVGVSICYHTTGGNEDSACINRQALNLLEVLHHLLTRRGNASARFALSPQKQ